MGKVLVLASLLGAALAGCAQQQQPATSLAQIAPTYGAPTVEIVANGQVNVLLSIPTKGDCPVMSDRLTATYDGAPMRVARGGYDTTTNSCYPIAFWFDAPPTATIDGFEKSTNSTQLRLVDESATWTMQTSKLFADDFVDDSANHRIVWQDVPTITTAEVSPSQRVTIQGNAIVYQPGTEIDWVSAHAHPTATTCDGPGQCTVDVDGSRTLRQPSP